MDSLLFHPKLVHIPMALGVLMPLVAGGLLLAWWRKWLPSRAWAIAVLLQAALVASGVVALQTGEADEELVEEVVAERFIEEHEEAAEAFVGVGAAVLGVMLLGLITSRSKLGLQIASTAAAGTLVVLAFGIRTGHAGGALVYQHGAAAAHVDTGARSGVVAGRGSRDESHEHHEGHESHHHGHDDDD